MSETRADRGYIAWIGKRQYREETLTQAHVDGLNALLDREQGVPLGLQWLLCQDRVRQSGLGADGHPERGGFLPPVTLPRRMWAAGEITFHRNAEPGRTVIRDSTIADIASKRGRSGELVFVRVDHAYTLDGAPWIDERHTIVYRDTPAREFTAPAVETLDPGDFDWRERVDTDPVQLFRYSALTFNGHRIHYDQRYTTEIEGYPGLIVHGPLMATWLMNFTDRKIGDRALSSFAFRVHAPVFVGESITLLARESNERLELAVVNARSERIIGAISSLTSRNG